MTFISSGQCLRFSSAKCCLSPVLLSPAPPPLDLDMSCHRMDIAFHGIRRGLRTNFTLHSTALGLTETHGESEAQTQGKADTWTGRANRRGTKDSRRTYRRKGNDELERGRDRRRERESERDRVRVELNVRRPHSLIPVETENVLPSLTTSLSPRACRGDGAILIPRCGFMNKISGLSDGGV